MPWGSGGKLSPIKHGHNRMICARWTGGGAAANCTRTTGQGVTSVNYNSATGKYVITFDSGYEVLEGYQFQHGGANATPKIIKMEAQNATAGTINIAVSDVATPTNRDLSTDDEISFVVVFRDEGVYSS